MYHQTLSYENILSLLFCIPDYCGMEYQPLVKFASAKMY